MAHGLTIKQRDIWHFIDDFQGEYGFSPTVPEIARAFQVSTACIRAHLDALIAKGRVRRTPGKFRGLVALSAGIPLLSVKDFATGSDNLV